MATIVPTFTKLRSSTGGVDAVVATWAGLAASGDVGQAITRADLVDRCIQFAGAFGGDTVVLEGSNDGVNYFTLSNPFGVSLSFTATGGGQITEAVAYIRPRVTAGNGGPISAVLAMRRTLR